MKIALFVGFMFFCSIWTIGIQYRNCYYCSSNKSYKDCEGSQNMTQCYDTTPCIQLYSKFDNGSVKRESFFKGCTHHRACKQFNKGNISELCYLPFAECKGKCCFGDECNKGNILDTTDSSASATTDSSKTSGDVLAISGSVLGLFFGLSLTVVSFN
ncbi:uncharacterized protein LOC144628237 isoform X1 [Oculina patagonica]